MLPGASECGRIRSSNDGAERVPRALCFCSAPQGARCLLWIRLGEQSNGEMPPIPGGCYSKYCSRRNTVLCTRAHRVAAGPAPSKRARGQRAGNSRAEKKKAPWSDPGRFELGASGLGTDSGIPVQHSALIEDVGRAIEVEREVTRDAVGRGIRCRAGRVRAVGTQQLTV
jgi:hypothetical protein